MITDAPHNLDRPKGGYAWMKKSSESIQYDSSNRMMYHPDFHTNQGKPYTLEDKAYLCYYYDIDEARSIGMALGRTEVSLKATVQQLKRKGEYEHYRKLWEYIQYKGWRMCGDEIESVDPKLIGG